MPSPAAGRFADPPMSAVATTPAVAALAMSQVAG